MAVFRPFASLSSGGAPPDAIYSAEVSKESADGSLSWQR